MHAQPVALAWEVMALAVDHLALGGGLQRSRTVHRPARLGHVFGQLGNLLQVLGVADHRLAPLRDQRAQQLAHRVVVGRVHRRGVDDELAHIVFNRLGHRLVGLHHALGRGLRRIRAALHDQLDQAQLLKGGNLLALFGANIGVDLVPHGGLVGLGVDVVGAEQAQLVAQLASMPPRSSPQDFQREE